ncbi:cell wall metabolism sensor histidine kinase WalK [Micromonospora sp. KC723]|uniref:sensor histidine kinase n=1 Tax=Micromonospora sp. KC723 TaxID=2530381 RepID=UPI001044EBE2|nr:ATP-binding protein [Micromonospora sp. KC723]TDB78453.1 HAMP domain-containing protein [Micromonospora sp. KC723]
MSFRLRVLALVALVALTATAATAWLVLRQASQQITESVTADQKTTAMITDELRGYGMRHGTWEGVASVVERLHGQTGQRIRLITEGGEVLVDTDHLQGRRAREVTDPPISVNPRHVLHLPETELPPGIVSAVTAQIDDYRQGIFHAACLTRSGAQVLVTDGPYGVPRYSASPADGLQAVADCAAPTSSDVARRRDQEMVSACVGPTRAPAVFPSPTPGKPRDDEPADGKPLTRCLRQAFSQRVVEFAPQTLAVYVGARDEPTPSPLAVGPVLVATGLVAVLAIAGSLLVSRRVLRPIEALTSASRRLGAGDLTERVPVVGQDELAVLARSFNRMADSLQRGEERQRRLVADVAHELRTPLANLRGYLEALKDGVVPPDPALFASLHEEAVLQQRIVDDLQDLALAEAGTLVYHRSVVDLAELLETCRIAHQAVADAAGVLLVTSAADPVHVNADPDRLRQVLGNLLSNALRATAGGAVTLAATGAGQQAVITVADTGTGITPEHLPYVFDRFWRADAARGRSTGGSGLGLAIVRQIVADHGGTVSVASEFGVGTTFTIHLPLLLTVH